MKNRLNVTHGASMPRGLLFGAAAAMLILLLGCGILAALIHRERIGESGMDYGVMILLLVSSWAGSAAAYGKIRRQRLAVCLAAGGVYTGILLVVTALLFGAKYSGVGATVLLICCGSLMTVFTGFRENRGGKRPKIKIANR